MPMARFTQAYHDSVQEPYSSCQGQDQIPFSKPSEKGISDLKGEVLILSLAQNV